MMNKEQLKRVSDVLETAPERLKDKHILAGFDGYIDKLVRLKKNQEEPVQYFETVKEFADCIGAGHEQSSDIEVVCTEKKLGGNGTLFADAISRKNISCTCIGAMGCPDLEPEYRDLSRRAHLISLTKSAESLAMEFCDGKLMFGDSGPFYELDWHLIREKIPWEELLALFDRSQILTFANWSGLPHSNDILKGILQDIVPSLSTKKRYLFFDLADPSAKSMGQFQEFFEIVKSLRACYHIVLGVNKKECLAVYSHYFGKAETDLSENIMIRMAEEMPIDQLSVHILDRAYIGQKNSPLKQIMSKQITQPKVVTGGGDNFNAGYCAGILLGLDPCDCSCLGNLSSMLFVMNGISPSLDEIKKYIDNKIIGREYK